MKQRVERMGVEIQAALGEIIARGEIKDPRVRNAGLVTVTRVRVTGDLREARVAFTVHGADESRLGQTRNGLTSARAYLQQALAKRLRTRNTPTLSFEIDRALDQAFYVDGLLREVAAARVAEAGDQAPPEDAGDASVADDGDQADDDGTGDDGSDEAAERNQADGEGGGTNRSDAIATDDGHGEDRHAGEGRAEVGDPVGDPPLNPP